ncbi:B3 domain-containing protein REM13-like isoform X2 [Euphorbia lathyris]|uniref:B3 domain-containing protein REM13-like isoform X2 n=1 Tax=Euphorbia lathyris TaxID=212925 RepID=UPI0033140F0D
MSTTLLTKPHFFKPLLPGFQDDFLIPAAYSKYLKEQNCETAMLGSRQGGKLWPVKINCRRFEDGWKQFVEDHGLQIGDFLVFRHEGDLVFYVLVFDRTSCEKEYPSFTATEDHEQNLPRDSISGKKVKTSLEEKASSSVLEYPYSVIQLTPNSIKKSRLKIPHKFAREHGLYDRLCSMILKDEEGNCWPALLYKSSNGKTYIAGGWTSYIAAHKLKAGDSLIVELTTNGKIPVLKMRRLQEHPEVKQEVMDENNAEADTSSPGHLHATTEASNLGKSQLQIPEGAAKKSGCSKKLETKKNTKTRKEAKVSSSVLEHPNCVIKLTPGDVKKSRLYIPWSFTRELDLRRRNYLVILKDEEENCWPARLSYRSAGRKFFVAGGWGSFQSAHKLKAEDSLIIQWGAFHGKTPVMKIYRLQELPEVKQEIMDQNNAEADSSSPGHLHATTEASNLEKSQLQIPEGAKQSGCLNKLETKKKVKTRLEAKASSSVLEHPNRVVKLTPGSIKKSRLPIPLNFARELDLRLQSYSVILKDEEENCWPAKLLYRSTDRKFFVAGGWGAFQSAHKLKAGDSLIIQRGAFHGKTPVMKIYKADSSSPGHLHATTVASNLEKSQLKVPEKVAKESGMWRSQKNKQTEIASEAKTTSVVQQRFLVVKIYDSHPWCASRLYIGKFARLQLENNKHYKVILIDREGRSWPANLDGQAYITDGWKEFRIANNLKPGDSFVFEFIEKGKTPILKMCELKTNEKAGKNEETASSSIKKPYVYVPVKSDVRNGQIRIPLDFAWNNGLATSKCSEITIKNEMGNSWTVKTEMDKNYEVFIRHGWTEFAEENGIKEGDVFVLELVKEEGKTFLMNYYAPKQVMSNNESAVNSKEATLAAPPPGFNVPSLLGFL